MAGRRVTTSGPVLSHLLYSTWDGVRRMARNFIRQEVREEHNLVPLVSSFLFDTSQSSTRSFTCKLIYRHSFPVEERLGTSLQPHESSRALFHCFQSLISRKRMNGRMVTSFFLALTWTAIVS